ncbi:unnamed protein product [Musa acuminata subsp. burmannicoides]
MAIILLPIPRASGFGSATRLVTVSSQYLLFLTFLPLSYPKKMHIDVEKLQLEVVSWVFLLKVQPHCARFVFSFLDTREKENNGTSWLSWHWNGMYQRTILCQGYQSTSALMERIPSRWPRPTWHPPWKNYRVISGHLGWVRSIAFDPSNSWFCTGSADRTIKIWDVASGRLKLTLTGHIEQIRGLAVSQRHTYLFSAGDDKQVKCWDLEQNKVIRSYHGHLSGVYCLALHPTIDVLLTGGRDSVCRVWDIRMKAMVMALSGHDNTVCSVFARPTDPQVVTGSHDTTIKFWDLVAGKTITVTHHKKYVRAMALHPKERAFASASADNIKKFNLPKGEFLHNMLSQQRTIINSMAVNEDGVLATAGDNGSLWFWDWKSGHNFQQAQTIVQPGSLDSEECIYALSYDISGSRLVTCEADKTIKMWKEDQSATPETHPLNFKPPKEFRRY